MRRQALEQALARCRLRADQRVVGDVQVDEATPVDEDDNDFLGSVMRVAADLGDNVLPLADDASARAAEYLNDTKEAVEYLTDETASLVGGFDLKGAVHFLNGTACLVDDFDLEEQRLVAFRARQKKEAAQAADRRARRRGGLTS